MSSDWKEVSLDEIADLNGGYAFKSEEYTEVGHFVLRTVNISDDGRICQDGAAYVSPASAKKYERFQLKDLDTLFVMVGATLGKTGLVKAGDLPALLNQNMWVVRAKTDQVDPLFLHYAFKVISRPMCSLASGSARGFVKRDDFRQMRVRVPEIRVQRRISDLLGALDDRITLLRETNTTLEAIAQALFKSWFVDFDPVHAKMQGRAPEGMDETTAALFPDSFEESELAAMPKGWRLGLLSDLMKLHKGSINPLNHPEVFFSHFSLPAFDEGQMPVLEVGYEIKSNKTTVPPNAVLVSKLNPHIPRIWLPSAVASNAVCSTEFLPFVPTSRATTNFVYAILNEPSFMNAMTQLVTGTSNSHQRIKPDSVLSLKHVVPEESTIKAFEEIVSPMMDRMKATRHQIGWLASIRDTLLPRLIYGQVSLSEVAAENI